MHNKTLELSLKSLDCTEGQSIVLFINEDRRPLSGAAGLYDWRMQGKLSNFLIEQRINGKIGEVTLTLPHNKDSFKQLFIFGVGLQKEVDQNFRKTLEEALETLKKAKAQQILIDFPALGAHKFQEMKSLCEKELKSELVGIFAAEKTPYSL